LPVLQDFCYPNDVECFGPQNKAGRTLNLDHGENRMKKIGRAVLGSFGDFLGNAGGTVSFDTLDAWSSLEAAIKHLAKKEDYEVFYWEQSKTMRRKGEVLQRLLEFDDVGFRYTKKT